MKFSITKVGKYRVLKIEEPFLVLTELDDLTEIVESMIAKGDLHFYVNFSEISYIYSGAIGALIGLYKKLKSLGGTIGILEPRMDVLTILNDLKLSTIIPIIDNEETLRQTSE
jgi:anti-anti-sigma factor